MVNVIIKTNVLSITHEDQEVNGLKFNVTSGPDGVFFIAIEGEQAHIDAYVERVQGTISSQEELDAYIETLPKLEEIGRYPTEIELAKKQHLTQLAEACDKAVHEGFVSSLIRGEDFLEFSFNEKFQNEFVQQTLIVLANGGFEKYPLPIQWKTKNAGLVTLTGAEYGTVITEAAKHKTSQQAKYWDLEQQVELAETVEELIEIVW